MTSASQPLSAYSADTCMFCRQLLRITTSEEESEYFEGDGAATIIDDVELYCGPPGSGPSGHHTHWSCLIDYAKQARTHGILANPPPNPDEPFPSTLTTCIVCGQNTLDPYGRFLVDVQNEGGETKGFDFGEIMEEEEPYLDTNSSQVHIRAFHDLVAGGDYAGAIELIAEHDVDINSTHESDGLTALQKAMFNGDRSGVQFLTSLGAK